MEKLKQVKNIIIHHSHNPGHSIESIRNLHVNKNKWEDIGYHWFIGNGKNTKDGKLYKGRSEKFQGAHVYGHNKNSIGICLIGNFDKEPATKKQIKKLIKLLKKKIKKHKLSSKDIFGHCEFNHVKKTCPGKFLDIEEIRELISQK